MCCGNKAMNKTYVNGQLLRYLGRESPHWWYGTMSKQGYYFGANRHHLEVVVRPEDVPGFLARSKFGAPQFEIVGGESKAASKAKSVEAETEAPKEHTKSPTNKKIQPEAEPVKEVAADDVVTDANNQVTKKTTKPASHNKD